MTDVADPADELQQLLQSAARGQLLLAVFSSPASAAAPHIRVDVRPVRLKGSAALQFAARTTTQEFHSNLRLADAVLHLQQLADGRFRNIRIVTSHGETQAVAAKNGRWKLHQKFSSPTSPPATDTALPLHDRHRNHLIPAGQPCPFLIHTGVMTADGTVRTSHSRKFRQINRFLEFIHDVADALPADRTLHVVDFGCGKSYLTFATHHLLATLLQRDCRITGLDRRDDVVATCRQISSDLQLPELQFQAGEISGFVPECPPDLVVSLHACDTATDDALAQAVHWQASVVLAVPCCQHEMHSLMQTSPLGPVTDFGITRERFCALATDAIRAALMTAAGYSVQLLEFIDMEHTPKNILLRCVRRRSADSPAVRAAALQKARDLRRSLALPPLRLERLLFPEPADSHAAEACT
ncbi:MAG: class I SAM-dependent methyltransferase [Planctomyces sp.]